MRFSEILRACGRKKNFIAGACMVGFMLLLTVTGLFWTPCDPNMMDTGNKLRFFSLSHPLGTDQFGRDILSRVMEGARSSFAVGFLAVAFGLVAGGLAGAAAGYCGGWADWAVSKLVDVQMAFPGVLLALMLIAVSGTGLAVTALALGLMSVPRFARIARSGFLKYRDADFIRAARARGAGDGRIIFRHILPHVAPDLIVTCSLSFASAVISEAGLSYLGLGAQPPTPSFGNMLSEAQSCLFQAGWYVLVPAAAITLLVMGFNLMGDALREVTGHE